MFKQLFATFTASTASGLPRRHGVDTIRQAYDTWRIGRDIDAIEIALDRLSDRQLHLIGLCRDSLSETVEDMIVGAEQDRAIGREVMALLEAPTGQASSRALETDESVRPKRVTENWQAA